MRTRRLAVEAGGPDLPADEGLYRQEVRYTLGQIADMVELLAAEELLSRSVVAVTADHGELFQSDQRFGRRQGDRAAQRLEGHGSALYGELLRVPLVVRAPAERATRPTHRTEVLASHVDLVPTFLEAPRPGGTHRSGAVQSRRGDGNGRSERSERSEPKECRSAGGAERACERAVGRQRRRTQPGAPGADRAPRQSLLAHPLPGRGAARRALRSFGRPGGAQQPRREAAGLAGHDEGAARRSPAEADAHPDAGRARGAGRRNPPAAQSPRVSDRGTSRGSTARSR